MNCNCQWTELILGIAIIVFAWWQTSSSQWIVIIAAALLILHSFSCKNCKMPANVAKTPTVKATRRKKL